MTIRQKTLLWFLIPSVLIPIGIAFFCYFYTRKVVERNIFDQLEIAAGELQLNVRIFLDAKRGRIIDFCSDGFIRDCTEAITKGNDSFRYYSDRLNTHLTLNKKPLDPDILVVFIVDLDGKVISSTDNDQIGRDVSGETWFSATKRRGFYISDIKCAPDFRQNTFFDVAKLLLTNDGLHTVAIISNRYSGNSFKEITRSEDIGEFGQVKELKGLGETGEVYIVNKDKLMITESRFNNDVVLKQVVDTEGVRVAFDNEVGMIGIYTGYKGHPILGVSRYIEEMDWVILAEKDVSEALAPVVWLRNFFIIVGASGILIMVIISMLISTGITKSIKRLISGTKRIAGGDLEHPINIKEMGGEIKELGDSFNVMMRELSESINENRELFFQVRKGRDEWRKTFDTIADIITIHDKDHKILMANKAFYEKFKIDKEELLGKICVELFYGWQSCPLERSVKSSKPESEVVDDPHMGGVFIKSTYPMKDEKGEIYAYVHLAKDITVQKELQAELIEKARELEKANKEMEDFVYLTSHDLKEPLFVIGGFTSRLSMAYDDALDDKGKMFIRRIKVNVEKMNQRICEIMEVLKAGKIEYNFKKNDSGAIVKDAIDTLQEKILENKITLSVQDNLPTIFCDDVRMKDVFLNLLSNAIKYMGNDKHTDSPLNPPFAKGEKSSAPFVRGRGGFINAGCGEIKIGCNKNGGYYKFIVEDTGIGIQADYQKQIFKIFKRLNDIEVEGTGVGLSIVRQIVERHRGDIWVESPVRDGKGSRFCFTIPITQTNWKIQKLKHEIRNESE